MYQSIYNFPRQLLALVPCLTMLVAVYLDEVILPAILKGSPDISLAVLFVWVLYRPDLVFAPFVLLLGIYEDCILLSPLGFSSILALGSYWVIVIQRHHIVSESFLTVWLGFSLLVGVLKLITYIVAVLYTVAIPLSSLLMEVLATILLYPLVARVMMILQGRLPEIGQQK